MVNVSSCLGISGVAKLSDYCSSKFAVVGLTESLRREIDVLGLSQFIYVTVICPFLFRSRMFQKVNIKWKWLTRELDAKEIVDQIQGVIESRQQKEIWTPWYVFCALLVRMLPVGVGDRIYNLFGANKALLTEEDGARIRDISCDLLAKETLNRSGWER